MMTLQVKRNSSNNTSFTFHGDEVPDYLISSFPIGKQDNQPIHSRGAEPTEATQRGKKIDILEMMRRGEN